MKTFLYLTTIYLVWGSTYLAMRIGVMPGSGFPPFALGAARLLIAGPILLLFSRMRGHKIFISKRDMFDAAVAGLLMWLAGHGLILWSEQYVDSGYASKNHLSARLHSLFGFYSVFEEITLHFWI